MPLYLVTCVCDEGVWESSFKVFDAESRLDVAREIYRDQFAWRHWLERSKVWTLSYDEQKCPSPEVLLARIDASTIDGDSTWALRIHEIKAVTKLPIATS